MIFSIKDWYEELQIFQRAKENDVNTFEQFEIESRRDMEELRNSPHSTIFGMPMANLYYDGVI